MLKRYTAITIHLWFKYSSQVHKFLIIHSTLSVFVKFQLEINYEKLRNGIFLINSWKKQFSPSIGCKNCVLIIKFLFRSIIRLSIYSRTGLFIIKFKFYSNTMRSVNFELLINIYSLFSNLIKKCITIFNHICFRFDWQISFGTI